MGLLEAASPDEDLLGLDQAVAAAVGLSAELERMLSDTDELVARVDAAPVAAEPAQEQPQA